MQFDVVVVGTGAAGLSAALAASVHGAKTLVLEKAAVLGGTTAMSGGCIWIPGHHYMAAQGLSDSREAALAYIRAVSPDGWHNTEEPLWAAFVDYAPEMLKFVEAHSPTRFNPNRDPDPYAEETGGMAYGRNISPAPIRIGQLGAWKDKVRAPTKDVRISYEEVIDNFLFANPKRHMPWLLPRLLWRKLTGAHPRGRALTIGLLKGCLDNGVEVWPDTAAKRLLSEDGRVTGLEVERDGQSITLRAAKGVILASGGFDWNRDMMAEHFPGPVEWTAAPRSNTGDGQRMAAAVGARLDHMDQALIMGVTPVQYEGYIHGEPAADYFLPHCMIVNRHGHRFVNEKQMNIGLAFAEMDPDTGTPAHLPAWRIYDNQFATKYPHAMPNKSVPDNYFTAATLEELAGKIDVDPDGLAATGRRFSAFARAGVDDEFGRGASIWDQNRGGDPDHKPNPTLGTIEQAPFYAMPFKAGFLATKGGARTNARAEVLNQEGEVIAGLYAAGNVMANSFGSKGVGAGTTLGPCLTWGYIAALNAVGVAQ
ncbi:MAG: FAD-dependent oxidoreductase [Rhodospirillaceae bacterium]|nr:FAD-dependent oxidoreductase [Rhodospirillaceae bacterium]MBT4689349.1 FAD-dependent oxidoreductase [Rhodospirillaceae bacterium]MBT5083111.1 FAD-dependent oxidoreductase [Rhodospirillaceae bacterium]MBT5526127.1 FAD-dependent oxidoreductase [Rhodospirillaceae bacterium]MBT5879656.1 FAD-dependent oxidoreductase [Rhodospirillaceae bacterium]